MKRARVAVRRFLRDDNGAIVIDHIASFFFIILLVLLIFEICIAYFMNIRSYKAAQIGARVASILPPVHADVPLTNQRANGLGRLGMPCYNPNGLDRCVNPGGPWVCNGSDLDSSCNTALFSQVVTDMRRTFPDLQDESVTIRYIYRQLGETGGPFVPEVNVSIQAHEYEFVIFSLGSDHRDDQLVGHGGTRYSGVTASAFGEDMTPEITQPLAQAGG
jgi:hypothetical protein